MSKRYDGSQQALDLKGLRSDPGTGRIQVDSASPILRLVETPGDLSAGKILRVLWWARWPGQALSDFPLLPADLVSQNIDVVLNRRSCMAATLRIIEENIPEVRPLSH